MKKIVLLLSAFANATHPIKSHADNFKGYVKDACEGEEKCHKMKRVSPIIYYNKRAVDDIHKIFDLD